jgi:cell division protein ZapA (FtsZ GTPase activity inhibitor)
MSIIEINIGDKKYKISCKAGEEAHILALSKKFNEKFCNLQKNLGNRASEGQVLVIMGLMLEDELHNSQKNSHSSNNISEEKLPFIYNKVDNLITQLENLKVA